MENIAKGVSALVLAIASAFFGAYWGSYWQSKHESEEKMRTAAQEAAKDMTKLLFEAHSKLRRLLLAAGEKNWEDLKESEWREYRDFRDEWGKKIVLSDFELRRYFGKDLADNVMHVDQIDISPPAENLSSRNPCAYAGRSGDYDLVKQVDQIECYARWVSVGNQAVEDMPSGKLFDALEDERKSKKIMYENLREFEKNVVRFVRSVEKGRTALGTPIVIYK